MHFATARVPNISELPQIVRLQTAPTMVGAATLYLQTILLEDLLQGCDQSIGVVLVEHDGRLHLEHVVVRAVGADEDAVIAHAVGDVGSVMGRGLAGLRVKHQLSAHEEPEPAHIANQRVTLGQRR